jgi:hypothetical protein
VTYAAVVAVSHARDKLAEVESGGVLAEPLLSLDLVVELAALDQLHHDEDL